LAGVFYFETADFLAGLEGLDSSYLTATGSSILAGSIISRAGLAADLTTDVLEGDSITAFLAGVALAECLGVLCMGVAGFLAGEVSTWDSSSII